MTSEKCSLVVVVVIVELASTSVRIQGTLSKGPKQAREIPSTKKEEQRRLRGNQMIWIIKMPINNITAKLMVNSNTFQIMQ